MASGSSSRALSTSCSIVSPSKGWVQCGATSADGSSANRRSCSCGWGRARTGPRHAAESAIRRSRSRTLGPHRSSPARSRPAAASSSRQRSSSDRGPAGQSITAAALMKSGWAGPSGRVRHSRETETTRLSVANDSRACAKAFRGSPRLPPKPTRISMGPNLSVTRHTIATWVPFEDTPTSAKVLP